MPFTGTVARLITDKGFGFITQAQSDREFFFHRSSVEGVMFEQLHPGQAVTFEEGRADRGPRAERVRAL